MDFDTILTQDGLLYGNGSEVDLTTYKRSGFIAVSEGDTFEYCLRNANNAPGISFYTSAVTTAIQTAYSLLGDFTIKTGTWTAPADGYIRVVTNTNMIGAGGYFRYVGGIPSVLGVNIANVGSMFDDISFYGESNYPTFTKNSDASITVNFPAYFLRIKNVSLVTNRASYANTITYTGNSSLTVPHNSFLVYDKTNRIIEVLSSTYNELNSDKVVLFFNSGGSVIGAWNRYYLLSKINANTENISVIPNELSIHTKNARHVKGNSITPLTLLHFSDIHADSAALARIMNVTENFVDYDDAICTGDLVANQTTTISSWWDESVMTCIGNHDTCTYNSTDGYNWTALSMADRDSYYIAPFESNWGVTHTTGTSYYYKDYSDQKVRLIVMDSMLYMSVDTSTEANAQTEWLASLLASAMTDNLHVLIAIHSPHAGASPINCSFSKYGQGTMGTDSSCNTPDEVVAAVASAITSGLKFIGYICGHTHQDNIFDANGDGKQLMYCITCAHISNVNQWKNSDQYRGTDADAFNILTIDTVNTLVKIVRGGGADIDDHMRTRKAICFNYSTGAKVGEVL